MPLHPEYTRRIDRFVDEQITNGDAPIWKSLAELFPVAEPMGETPRNLPALIAALKDVAEEWVADGFDTPTVPLCEHCRVNAATHRIEGTSISREHLRCAECVTGGDYWGPALALAHIVAEIDDDGRVAVPDDERGTDEGPPRSTDVEHDRMEGAVRGYGAVVEEQEREWQPYVDALKARGFDSAAVTQTGGMVFCLTVGFDVDGEDRELVIGCGGGLPRKRDELRGPDDTGAWGADLLDAEGGHLDSVTYPLLADLPSTLSAFVSTTVGVMRDQGRTDTFPALPGATVDSAERESDVVVDAEVVDGHSTEIEGTLTDEHLHAASRLAKHGLGDGRKSRSIDLRMATADECEGIGYGPTDERGRLALLFVEWSEIADAGHERTGATLFAITGATGETEWSTEAASAVQCGAVLMGRMAIVGRG